LPNTASQLLAECTNDEPLVVVGNGKGGIGRGLGPVIDAAPCVVRFNHFYMDGRGFGKDYGTKCDIHVCSTYNNTPGRARVTIHTAWPNKLAATRWGKGKPAMSLVNDHGTRRYHSAGYSFVMMALNLVPKIWLVGFDHATTGHYWERHVHSHNHDWNKEAKHFAAFAQTGRIHYLDRDVQPSTSTHPRTG
jgi:hypothetical protein